MAIPTATMATYKRQPVTFARGAGAYLWDTNDRRYLDALSGIAVCGLGHAHPRVAAAICDQARTLVHTSNLYNVALQERLAARLRDRSGLKTVFFCNSGAEANEAALKIARRRANERGIGKPTVVVAHGSFHGRTLATLSATGNEKVRAGFAPLVEGFIQVNYGDAAAVAAVMDENVVAVMVEPVQGEGGINVPPPAYLPSLRRLCDEHDALLILDEIQTGNCRSGRWFAYQHADLLPDVVTLAKGLGNGLPIGACLAGESCQSTLGPGSHGSTFGGNPLACRAALEVLDILEEEHLAERAEQLGNRMCEAFRKSFAGRPGIRDVRGLGLLLGIELDRDCGEIVERGLERGILVNVTAGRVIRLLPPLTVSDAEADEIVTLVTELVLAFLHSEAHA